MSSPIRGEQWILGYAVETTYGTDPGIITPTCYNTDMFGIVQSATMPDPTVDFQPFYGHSTTNKRNWFITYKGKQSLSGSIPDILLLDGRILRFPIGTVVTSPALTHTISEATTLDSISLHITNTDADGNVELMRRFHGGKINRATFTATEGGFLTMGIDEILFNGFSNNITGELGHSASVVAITPTYPTTQPYLFSYGALSLGELGTTEFARVREFRLTVDNACEAKYYVTDNATTQLPYEHREGRRTYTLGCNIDIEDNSLYKELLRQGTYTSVYKGFQANMVFTRGAGDTITFTTPPSASAAGGDAMGCLIRSAPHNIVTDPLVSVPLDIICRSLQIVCTDAIASYP